MSSMIGSGIFVIAVGLSLKMLIGKKEEKVYRRYYVLGMLSIYLLSSFFSKVNAGKTELGVKIELNKDVYLVRESIWITRHIENTGKEAERIWIDPYNVILKDSKGKRIKKMEGLQTSGMGGGPAFKKPGEKSTYTWDFRPSFGKPLFDDPWNIRHLPPDEYTVQVLCWVGNHKEREVLSNKVKFRVIEPTGKEANAHELIKEVEELRAKRKFDDYQPYWKLIELYPNSVYAPQSYLKVIKNLRKQKEFDKSIQKCGELMEKYTDSWAAAKCAHEITYCLKLLGKKDQTKEQMQKLISKYKGMKIEEGAKLCLLRYEEKQRIEKLTKEILEKEQGR